MRQVKSNIGLTTFEEKGVCKSMTQHRRDDWKPLPKSAALFAFCCTLRICSGHGRRNQRLQSETLTNIHALGIHSGPQEKELSEVRQHFSSFTTYTEEGARELLL